MVICEAKQSCRTYYFKIYAPDKENNADFTLHLCPKCEEYAYPGGIVSGFKKLLEVK